MPQPSPRDPYDPVARRRSGPHPCAGRSRSAGVCGGTCSRPPRRPGAAQARTRRPPSPPRGRSSAAAGRRAALHRRLEPLLALGARELREAVAVGDHEAEDVRLLACAVELVGGERSRQVLEGPGGGGEGQAVVNGGIEGGGAVDSEAVAGSASPSVTVTCTSRLVWPESPDRRRAIWWLSTAPSPHASTAAISRRGARRRGPDLVHAAVQRHEPAALDSPRDRPPADPGIEELRGRDDAVLPSRERHDRAVGRCISSPRAAPSDRAW